MNYSIGNLYHYSDTLAAGAEPTADQISDLKNDGFEVIINISPVSAKNALRNESKIVENLKLDYVHFPVDCLNLPPIHYKTFEGIMNDISDKKIFVHCGGNIKSSNLIHMYHVIAKGRDEEESLETLNKIQKPEDKWFTYFRNFGMEGVR